MAAAVPPVSPIQTRFDGGVISPRFAGRFDSELYKKALKSSNNFEPLPQGSLRMRSGSEKIQALTGDANTKLIQIRSSTGQDFLVELTNNTLHLYSLDGGVSSIQTIGQSQLINNGGFGIADGFGWKMYGAGPWSPITGAGFTSTFRDFAGLSQLGYADFGGNITGALRTALTQRIVIPFDATIHVEFDIPNGSQTPPTPLSAFLKISTSDPATWADGNGGGEILNSGPIDLSPVGTRHFDIVNGYAVPAGIYYFSLQHLNGFVGYDNISIVATYGAAQTDVPTPWTKAEAADVRFVTETGRDRTIFVHPGHAPWFLLYGGQPGNWSFGNIAFATVPLGWGDAGSVNVPAGWNWQGITGSLAQANWPSCVEMSDGRVYYAGEPAQKNRILGSKSGSSDDFTLGSNPGDSLDFKISTKGAIKWLRSNRVMLAGTDLGQHSITGSKGTPLVGDIQARPESAFPSASVQALTAGTQALYVSSDLRRVRAAAFDFKSQGWESRDITFAAEHLTKDLIKELYFAWTPDSVVIALLQSGKLALCTFEPVEQVTAWWTLDVGGVIVSAAVSQGPLGAYLWMAVSRNGSMYLEKLHLSESTEVLRYLDASVAAVSDANGDVSGLAHLHGLKVRVVKDGGGYLGDFYVTLDGTIQLGAADNANLSVIVGMPYLAKAETLPKDLRYGKGQSPVLGMILNESALPKLNGKRPPDRNPSTPMGSPESLITGKKTLSNLGWSGEDSITIEQDMPFRTEVCAVYSATQTEQSF